MEVQRRHRDAAEVEEHIWRCVVGVAEVQKCRDADMQIKRC